MLMSPQDIADLKAQGWSDYEIANAQPAPQQPIGTGATVTDTLKAHAGGTLGGGAGALAGMWAGAKTGALLGLPEEGIGAIPGALIGGTLGALGGGLIGQKAQQAVEPDSTYQEQQQMAAQAAQANPKTALATDIIGSALASGGRPSLDALIAGQGLLGKLAGKELTPEAIQALQGTLLNSAINPAINSGINYATTGELPSSSDLASQAIGGAIFSRQAKWASNLIGHGAKAPDESQTETSNNSPLQLENQPVPKQLTAPRRFFGNDSGIIDVDGEVKPTDEPQQEVTNQPKLLAYQASPSESGGQLQVSPDILQRVIDKGSY